MTPTIAALWRFALGALWVSTVFSVLHFIWQFIYNFYVFVIAPRCGWVPDLKQLLLDAHSADWAIVTGAGRGIGRGYARALASKGFNVVLIGKRREHLEKTANEISSLYRAIETRIVVFDFHENTDPASTCPKCRAGIAPIVTPRIMSTPRGESAGPSSPRPSSSPSGLSRQPSSHIGARPTTDEHNSGDSGDTEAAASKKQRSNRRSVNFSSEGKKCMGEQILIESIGQEILSRVGILINNVGIMGGERNFAHPFSSNFPDPIRFGFEMVNVNVKSAILMTGLVLPVFLARVRASQGRTRGEGKVGGIIVNLSSAVSIRPVAGSAIYCGSKAFIDFFSNALGQELGSIRGSEGDHRLDTAKSRSASLSRAAVVNTSPSTTDTSMPKEDENTKLARKRSLGRPQEGERDRDTPKAPLRRADTTSTRQHMSDGEERLERNGTIQQGAGPGILVQTVYPYFVRTALIPQIARDLFPSLLAPDPLYFARSALDTVGLQSRTSGCLEHALQDQVYRLLARLLPHSLFDMTTDLAIRSLARLNRKYLRTKRTLNAVVFDKAQAAPSQPTPRKRKTTTAVSPAPAGTTPVSSKPSADLPPR